MKISIDEAIFNKAIRENKFELAKWLLDVHCPVDKSCYLQNPTIDVLNWLKLNSITPNSYILCEVLEICNDIDVINWFINNNCVVDNKAIQSCIKQNNNELFLSLLEKYNHSLDIEAYKSAIISENIYVLNYLKKNNITISEEIRDYAMKNKKKESIKWMVVNNLFF